MYSKLDKSVLQSITKCNKKSSVLNQIENSCIKIFKDACHTLLHSPNVKLTNRKKKALQNLKPHIYKIINNRKSRKRVIKQKGGILLPFIIPLIASLL